MKVVPVMALSKKDSRDESLIGKVTGHPFIYLGGGSPRHLHRVLSNSPLWDVIHQAWQSGGTLAGSSAGAMVFGETMLAPRWTRPHPGFGLIPRTAIIPHHDAWIARVHKVTQAEAMRDHDVIGIDEWTGLVLSGKSEVVKGPGTVTRYRNGEVVEG